MSSYTRCRTDYDDNIDCCSAGDRGVYCPSNSLTRRPEPSACGSGRSRVPPKLLQSQPAPRPECLIIVAERPSQQDKITVPLTPFRPFRCVRPFIGLAIAAVCLVPGRASAAVTADFNGDGIADSVELSPSSSGRVVVRVSGGRVQVLDLAERVISLVAADVDHDGDSDLGILSEHRGVRIWLNADGSGHFAAHEKQRRHRRVVFQLAPSRSVSDHDDEGARAQSGPDGPGRILHLMGRYTIRAPSLAQSNVTWLRAHTPQTFGSPYASRAPPFHV